MILNEKLISEYKVERKQNQIHESYYMKLTNYRVFLSIENSYKNAKYKLFHQDFKWETRCQPVKSP